MESLTWRHVCYVVAVGITAAPVVVLFSRLLFGRFVEGTFRSVWVTRTDAAVSAFAWAGGVHEMALSMPGGAGTASWDDSVGGSEDLDPVLLRAGVLPERLGAHLDDSSRFGLEEVLQQRGGPPVGTRDFGSHVLDAIRTPRRARSAQLPLALELRALRRDRWRLFGRQAGRRDWIATGRVDSRGGSADVRDVALKAVHTGLWGLRQGLSEVRFLFPAGSETLVTLSRSAGHISDEVRQDLRMLGSGKPGAGLCVRVAQVRRWPRPRYRMDVSLGSTGRCQVLMAPVAGLAEAERALFGRGSPRQLMLWMALLVLCLGMPAEWRCFGLASWDSAVREGSIRKEPLEASAVGTEPLTAAASGSAVDEHVPASTTPETNIAVEPSNASLPDVAVCDRAGCGFEDAGHEPIVKCHGDSALCRHAVNYLIHQGQEKRKWRIQRLHLDPELGSFRGLNIRVNGTRGCPTPDVQPVCCEREAVEDPLLAVERILDACIRYCDVWEPQWLQQGRGHGPHANLLTRHLSGDAPFSPHLDKDFTAELE